MAIYFLAVKSVSRSTGRSAPAAAAYRAGSLHGAPIVNQRDGIAHDYRRRRDVEAAFILAPAGCEWAQQREDLWNRAEAAEKRKDAKTAREYIVALPDGLTVGQRRDLVASFGSALVARYGIAIDLAIHEPNGRGDQRNFHAHLLATTRTVGPDGLGAKTKALDSPKTSGPEVEWIRSAWGQLVNEHLEQCGAVERVSHMSHARQGTGKMPHRHLGPAVTALERGGTPTYLGDRNRVAAEINRLVEDELAEEARRRTADLCESAIRRAWAGPLDTELNQIRVVWDRAAGVGAQTEFLAAFGRGPAHDGSSPPEGFASTVLTVSEMADVLAAHPDAAQASLLDVVARAGCASREVEVEELEFERRKSEKQEADRSAERLQEEQRKRRAEIEARLHLALVGAASSDAFDIELCWNTGERSEATRSARKLVANLFHADADVDLIASQRRIADDVSCRLRLSATIDWLITCPVAEQERILLLAEQAGPASRQEQQISSLVAGLRSALTADRNSTISEIDLCWNNGARRRDTQPARALFREFVDVDAPFATQLGRKGDNSSYRLSIPAMAAWLMELPSSEQGRLLTLAEQAASTSRREFAAVQAFDMEQKQAASNTPPLVEAVKERYVRLNPAETRSIAAVVPAAKAPDNVMQPVRIPSKEGRVQSLVEHMTVERADDLLMQAVLDTARRLNEAGRATSETPRDTPVTTGRGRLDGLPPPTSNAVPGQRPTTQMKMGETPATDQTARSRQEAVQPDKQGQHNAHTRAPAAHPERSSVRPDPSASAFRPERRHVLDQEKIVTVSSDGQASVEQRLREALGVGPETSVWRFFTPADHQSPSRVGKGGVFGIVQELVRQGVKGAYTCLGIHDDLAPQPTRGWYRAEFQISDLVDRICRLGATGDAMIARLADAAKAAASYVQRVSRLQKLKEQKQHERGPGKGRGGQGMSR